MNLNRLRKVKQWPSPGPVFAAFPTLSHHYPNLIPRNYPQIPAGNLSIKPEDQDLFTRHLYHDLGVCVFSGASVKLVRRIGSILQTVVENGGSPVGLGTLTALYQYRAARKAQPPKRGGDEPRDGPGDTDLRLPLDDEVSKGESPEGENPMSQVGPNQSKEAESYEHDSPKNGVRHELKEEDPSLEPILQTFSYVKYRLTTEDRHLDHAINRNCLSAEGMADLGRQALEKWMAEAEATMREQRPDFKPFRLSPASINVYRGKHPRNVVNQTINGPRRLNVDAHCWVVRDDNKLTLRARFATVGTGLLAAGMTALIEAYTPSGHALNRQAVVRAILRKTPRVHGGVDKVLPEITNKLAILERQIWTFKVDQSIFPGVYQYYRQTQDDDAASQKKTKPPKTKPDMTLMNEAKSAGTLKEDEEDEKGEEGEEGEKEEQEQEQEEDEEKKKKREEEARQEEEASQKERERRQNLLLETQKNSKLANQQEALDMFLEHAEQLPKDFADMLRSKKKDQ